MFAPLSRAVGWLLVPTLLVLVSTTRSEGPARPNGKIDFNRDIRPILTENCLACHGPDSRKRKGDLRLDLPDPTHTSNKVIVPGKPGESELIKRLTTDQKGKLMPPAKSGKTLTPAQIKLLETWVAEGGKYESHWAFVAPVRPTLPTVKNTKWGRNPIDRFILARLEREGLSPSVEADKITLLRRVTFDLTGLPPTQAEIDAFLADKSSTAYEKVVDRLLDSPRYGEHMGRYWLDLARFGDTHGLHLDNYREMWPYRDWVIKAFNNNMPYDRFTLAQLAGDQLPGGKLADLIATGFNRAHVTTSEGGSISEEVHIRNVNDRVETVGTVFLGLTIGCAKCHDHKYDPISMKEFYSLTAYFNSLEGNPLDGNAARHPPVVKVPMPEQEKQLAELDKKIADIQSEMAKKTTSIVYDDKLDEGQTETLKRAEFVWIEDAFPKEVQPMTTADGGANWVSEPVHSGALSLRVSAKEMGQHFFTGAKPGLKVGAGDKLFAYVYLDPKNPPKEIMLQWHTATWKHRAYWGDNLIAFGKDNSTERKKFGDLPAVGKWVKLEVPIAQVGLKPGMNITGWAFTLHGGTAFFDHAGILTQTPQIGGTYDTLTAWVRVQRSQKLAGLPANIQAILKVEKEKRSSEQKKTLRDHFIQNAWSKTLEHLAPLRKSLAAVEAQRKQLDAAIPSTYVFKDAATPRQAYMLERGEYDRRKDPVQRTTPAFLPSLPAKAEKTRLELAKWLLTPQHPLTARVAVNRFWQQLYGIGIVKTSEDFGTQGEAPSHPLLLDWLAVEFRESNWDIKKMMRLLVTSSTYRQSSTLTKDLLTKDPMNRLLARGPRFRLDAEMLRDQALSVSGLLVLKMGGPSVKPPQPIGIWSAVAYVGSNTNRFSADKGEDKVHRRSVYTFWKRTAPPPQMSTFDAPSRESCVARRERTNTPLQALLMLNDPQYVECSRVLAERVLREGGKTNNERIAYLFRLVTSRKADAKEMAELSSALEDLLKAYRADEAGAKKLIAVGETKPDAKISPAELAAWTMLSSTVLNLDEVLTKG